MDSANNLDRKAFLALIAGAVAIGTAPIWMRYSTVTPASAAFWRMALALPVALLWGLATGGVAAVRQAVLDVVRYFGPLLLVGLWLAIDLGFWHWSVQKTTVANATLLANLAVVFTSLGGFLFFGERFGRRFMGGLALCLAGMGMLVGQNAELNPAYITGDMLGIAAAVGYAGYILSTSRIRSRISTLAVMIGTSVTTCLFLLPLAMMEDGATWPTSFDAWWPLVGLAVVTHVLGQGLIVYGLAHVRAAVGAATLLIQPVVAALLAFILFGEALGSLQGLGALAIFAGIYLARTSR
ncbi:DMT family transporter [Pseudokordiimonas caeni]|uniref:DMT family transporter n=1 Tax=Pseudokordiimonas caeni TaxID=2997908 RepID=UPI002811D07C|nr:DMT family transporter [Pseudokordiimonas caeni]